MWSLSGYTLAVIDILIALLPIESDFCRDFHYDSIQSTDVLHIPVDFSNSTMDVLYKVIMWSVLGFTSVQVVGSMSCPTFS